jgi:hypothetical protein
MTSIRSSAQGRLAVDESASISTSVAPKRAPDRAPAVAPISAPVAAQYVVAQHRMACSAVLELSKGSTFLSVSTDDPPPYAKRVSSFRAHAGTPSNQCRPTAIVCADQMADASSEHPHSWDRIAADERATPSGLLHCLSERIPNGSPAGSKKRRPHLEAPQGVPQQKRDPS